MGGSIHTKHTIEQLLHLGVARGKALEGCAKIHRHKSYTPSWWPDDNLRSKQSTEEPSTPADPQKDLSRLRGRGEGGVRHFSTIHLSRAGFTL